MNQCGQEVKHPASNKPFPSSTNPMIVIITIQRSLAYVKMSCILTAHFTLQQFITKRITKTRKKKTKIKILNSVTKIFELKLIICGSKFANEGCKDHKRRLESESINFLHFFIPTKYQHKITVVVFNCQTGISKVTLLPTLK